MKCMGGKIYIEATLYDLNAKKKCHFLIFKIAESYWSLNSVM